MAPSDASAVAGSPRVSAGRLLEGVLLWLALAVPPTVSGRLGLEEVRPEWQSAGGLAVLALAAGLARRSPPAAFALTATLSLLLAPALFTVSYVPALGVFALLLGLRAPRVREAATVLAAVGCAGTVRIALLGVDPAPEWLVLMCTLLFCCVFPWLGGRHRRQSRQLAEAGWARAARLESEQRLAEERARLRERARIAQDMHDSLGHELSLIALRAGALQVAADLPAHHREAAADLRAAASDATDRLHRIIGVLREDDEPLPLAPAGESVEQLVARAADSGLDVRWEARGPERAGPERAGPERAGRERAGTETPGTGEADSVAERMLYRVVREALTNAARHAPGAPVRVVAAREETGTTVVITNGRPTRESSPSSGGSGLLGLRAAVAAVGGDFSARAEGEGFRVYAYVPAEGTGLAAAGSPAAGSPAAGSPAVGSPVAGSPAVGSPAAAPAEAAPAPPPRLASRAPFLRARRRAALGIGAAAVAGAVLTGGGFAWYAYTETHSVLPPAAYAGLRLGTPAEEVGRVLPDLAVADPPVERAPAAPPGAECRYYRAGGELLTSVDHFRLCFERGRLVSKDVVPRAGATGTPTGESGAGGQKERTQKEWQKEWTR
ncbi:sensor histidine kinase [Streptomyces sp. NPDC093094]|uniref:sensor histidine kinase n=1 Tax=Streptomyces sp. NPDC093094 TaxID=3366026 RepID=UPI0037FF0345